MVPCVRVRVHEHGTTGGERRTELLDERRIPPLGDVRNRLEQRHPVLTLRPMREPTAPEYYDRRASEYDDWYLGRGLYADRERDGFDEELAQVASALRALPPARTLDVACGTGFLTRHVRGTVTGLDQSARMLAVARERLPEAQLVEGDGLALPFADCSFDRVLSGHFYGHLDETQRVTFLRQARRVAGELVLVDASRGHSDVREQWAPRVLADGSSWEVYKRWFTPAELLSEVGGDGEVLYAGDWFLVVRSR